MGGSGRSIYPEMASFLWPPGKVAPFQPPQSQPSMVAPYLIFGSH